MAIHWLCGEDHEIDGPPRITKCPALVELTDDLPLKFIDVAKRVALAGRSLARLIVQWDSLNAHAEKMLAKLDKVEVPK